MLGHRASAIIARECGDHGASREVHIGAMIERLGAGSSARVSGCEPATDCEGLVGGIAVWRERGRDKNPRTP